MASYFYFLYYLIFFYLLLGLCGQLSRANKTLPLTLLKVWNAISSSLLKDLLSWVLVESLQRASIQPYINAKSHYRELFFIYFISFLSSFSFCFFLLIFFFSPPHPSYYFSPLTVAHKIFPCILSIFFHMKLIPAESIISAGISRNGRNTPEWPGICS